MKTVAIILLAACMAAGAQTNKVEVIPELKTSARIYKNASVTSVSGDDAIVKHDGGIARVPLSEIPESIRKNLNSAPELNAKVLSPEDQKKIAEQKAAMAKIAAWRGEPKTLTVKTLLPSGACYVTFEKGDAKEIRITNLPGHIAKVFSDIKSAHAETKVAEAKLKQARRAYEDVPSSVTGDRQQVAAWEARAQRARDALRSAEDYEETVVNRYLALLKSQKALTTFSARQTAQKYNGYEIWEYHGKAIYE